jgi:WS/DGAT/MGAT family acyltransferase
MHVSLSRRHDDADRVTALDLSNLRVEEHGMPMHIAALAVLDGQPLLDEGGDLQMEQIRRHVTERIGDTERLHQVLVWPKSRRRTPTWEKDRNFTVADHVRTRRLPAPGDEETLLRACCELNASPLDRSRPLWELWLLNGLADGRVALLLRLHHVVADGAAALELFSSMFDLSSGTPAPGPVSEQMAGRSPTLASPAASHPGQHRDTPIARLKDIAAGAATRVRRGWSVIRLGMAPALSWNQPVGFRRVHRFLRGDLACAKAVAHECGGKVNDVVLAAVAGGSHALLESRGELAPDLDMHVSVAASIRRPGETGGNRVGVRLVPVPVSDPDAANRLRTIAARTAAQRRWPPLQPGGRFQQRWVVRVMAHQRLVNMVLSNMPGPPVPLSFAGASVQEMFQISLLQGNCAIGIGVLSYAGQLNVDVVADPDVVPDVDVFANGVAETLEQLGVTRSTRRPTAER